VRAALGGLGLGLIAGASDNDPTTVGTLAIIGAQTGFGLSWLIVLLVPMLIGVQAIASSVGIVTGTDVQTLIRQRFGGWWSWFAVASLVSVNLVTVVADLEAGAVALGLLTGRDWRLFCLPIAAAVGALLLLGTYRWLLRTLTYVLCIFLLYIPAAFLAHPDWHTVFHDTFVPHFAWSRDYVAGTLALLGTTLTSYVYYWQTIEEREAAGKRSRRLGQLDAAIGMAFTGCIFWFILVATGATLGARHQPVLTAGDAASALRPLAGPFAGDLFAVALLASALLALPVLAASAAYAVSVAAGWPAGLSLPPRQSPRYSLVLVAILLLALPLTLLRVQPTALLFFAGIVGGIGTPLLLGLMLLIAADPRVMQGRPVSRGLSTLG
jgi:Mn2+/Fe2+ NRAMP family transporter